MWFFYVFALVPVLVGAFFLWRDKQVCWWEWLTGSAVAFALAGIFQLIAGIGMTDDIETWSGQVTSARQYSRWREYYEEAIYRTEYYYTTETYYTTDSKGRSQSHTRQVQHSRQVFDHWESRRRWHEAHWEVATTLGDYAISHDKYAYLCKKFNDEHPVEGRRRTSEHNSKMIDGDPNDYVADNRTGWIEPVSTTKHFENRVKACPSVFSFTKVPTNIAVYPWPKTTDLFTTERVMGTARAMITTLKWDQMNAVLGPTKRINVIIIGFGEQGQDIMQYQQAAWVGGKKNDLVICFGGGSKTQPARWCSVFGWTENEMVKQTLQSLLLETPINDNIIPQIASLVNQHYVIKDWHKFDYLTIDPPTWAYWVYILVLLATQGGLYYFFHVNEYTQDDWKGDGGVGRFRSLRFPNWRRY